METGFIVVYIGSVECGVSLPLCNIGDRLKVTEVTVSSISGTTYYAVTDGRTKGAWYDAKLFKRLDDIRAEILDEIGI
jgi:hypothetical protein